MHVEYQKVLKNIESILNKKEDNFIILYKICKQLEESISHYDWVGFYFAVPKEQFLVLGPFAGAKTEHIRIKYGEGVCGQVALSKKALVIENVNEEENYLSCSINVKSEIVVPIFSKEAEFLGELDIDSHLVDAFDKDDLALLTKIAELTTNLIPRY